MVDFIYEFEIDFENFLELAPPFTCFSFEEDVVFCVDVVGDDEGDGEGEEEEEF